LGTAALHYFIEMQPLLHSISCPNVESFDKLVLLAGNKEGIKASSSTPTSTSCSSITAFQIVLLANRFPRQQSCCRVFAG
jgi:hypothetical protein